MVLLLNGTNVTWAQEYHFTTNLNLHIQNPSSGYSGTLPIKAIFTKCVGSVYMLINFNRSSFVPTHYTYEGVKYPIQQIKHLNPSPDVECVTFNAEVIHWGSVCFQKKLSCVMEGTSCYDLGYVIAEAKDAEPYFKDFFFTLRSVEADNITRRDYKLEGKLREMKEAKKRELEDKKRAEEEEKKKEAEEKAKEKEAEEKAKEKEAEEKEKEANRLAEEAKKAQDHGIENADESSLGSPSVAGQQEVKVSASTYGGGSINEGTQSISNTKSSSDGQNSNSSGSSVGTSNGSGSGGAPQKYHGYKYTTGAEYSKQLQNINNQYQINSAYNYIKEQEQAVGDFMQKWDQMASGWGDRMYQAELKRRKERADEMRLEEEREIRRERERQEFEAENYRKQVIAENEGIARDNRRKNERNFDLVKRFEGMYNLERAKGVNSVESIKSYDASVWFFAINRSKVSVSCPLDSYSENNGFYQASIYHGFSVSMFTPFQIHRSATGYSMDEKLRNVLAENLGDDYILCGPFSYRNEADELGSRFLGFASDWVGFSVYSVNNSGNYQSVGTIGLWDTGNNTGHIDDFWGDKPVADSVDGKKAQNIWGNDSEINSGSQSPGEADIFGNPTQKNPESQKAAPLDGKQSSPAKVVPEKKNPEYDIFGNPINK